MAKWPKIIDSLYVFTDLIITAMKRKISLANKSACYLFANFSKQFKKGLEHYSIG